MSTLGAFIGTSRGAFYGSVLGARGRRFLVALVSGNRSSTWDGTDGNLKTVWAGGGPSEITWAWDAGSLSGGPGTIAITNIRRGQSGNIYVTQRSIDSSASGSSTWDADANNTLGDGTTRKSWKLNNEGTVLEAYDTIRPIHFDPIREHFYTVEEQEDYPLIDDGGNPSTIDAVVVRNINSGDVVFAIPAFLNASPLIGTDGQNIYVAILRNSDSTFISTEYYTEAADGPIIEHDNTSAFFRDTFKLTMGGIHVWSYNNEQAIIDGDPVHYFGVSPTNGLIYDDDHTYGFYSGSIRKFRKSDGGIEWSVTGWGSPLAMSVFGDYIAFNTPTGVPVNTGNWSSDGTYRSLALIRVSDGSKVWAWGYSTSTAGLTGVAINNVDIDGTHVHAVGPSRVAPDHPDGVGGNDGVDASYHRIRISDGVRDARFRSGTVVSPTLGATLFGVKAPGRVW